MSLVWLPVGLVLPTIIGWLALRLIEGKVSVLFPVERFVLGCLIGLTATMFVTFILHLTLGVSFTLIGFGLVQVGMLALLYVWSRGMPLPARIRPSIPRTAMTRWAKIFVGILAAWTAVKMIVLTVNLLVTPTVLDDTIDNWNLRGKLFYHNKELTLLLPFEEGNTSFSGISSYPPTVSMVKAYLSTLAGGWHDGLANSIHIAWFIALVLLLYWSLRRELPMLWALLGTYILTAMPLEMLHGTNPYAEVFVSVHVFAAVSYFFHALRADDKDRRIRFFRVSAAVTCLLPFTKNEGLIMHLPVLMLLVGSSLLWLLWKKKMSLREIVSVALWYIIPLLAVAIPWIAFKYMNGLSFGNAKSVSGLTLAWQPGVALAVSVMTFMEGNWLFLFPLLLLLLLVHWRAILGSPLLVLLLYVAIIYLGQLFLFFFTALSIEARMQTGYNRGLIQILPIIVLLTTLLLHRMRRLFQTNI